MRRALFFRVVAPLSVLFVLGTIVMTMIGWSPQVSAEPTGSSVVVVDQLTELALLGAGGTSVGASCNPCPAPTGFCDQQIGPCGTGGGCTCGWCGSKRNCFPD